MLDLKFIREKPEEVKDGLIKRGEDPSLVDKILEKDNIRRQLIGQIEALRAKKNIAEDKITNLQGKEKEKAIEVLKEAKKVLEEKEEECEKIENELRGLIVLLPNLPLPDVPLGQSDKDNVVVKTWGQKPKFNFPAKDYLSLAEALDIIDTKRASKTSGSRFGFLKGGAAILEFALVQFVFDRVLKKGFVPVVPPVMIRPELFRGLGYIDKSDEEAYRLEKDNLYLIGTAEHILGAMHADEIFEEKELPKRYLGFSTCFRREAGSYGKDTKGILRVHQFDKLEMFIFSRPEDSAKEQQLLLQLEEEIMQGLGLPYRVLRICTADLSRPSASSYDVEAYLPSEDRYRETHSNSNCTDFQARRLNIRYRQNNSQLSFVHTLNGTALAIGRAIIALIENYQTKEGFIRIPKVLWPYTHGLRIIK